jgi:ParB family chromosome partitioning protein
MKTATKKKSAKPRSSKRAAAPKNTYVEGLTTKVVVDVPIEDISPEEVYQFRLRTTTGDLKDSLLREGQREPVDLLGAKPYKIVDGYRRIAAIRELGWKTVKAFIHKDMTPAEAQRLAFLKNVVRKNLSPLDKANAIHQAKRRGRSLESLAEDFGISVKQVRRYEGLLALPESLQAHVDKGTLTMAHAKLLSDHRVDDVAKWVTTIDETKLNAAALARVLRKTAPTRARMGRTRSFAKVERSRVRLYAFTMSKDTPKVERLKAAELLADAAKALRAW